MCSYKKRATGPGTQGTLLLSTTQPQCSTTGHDMMFFSRWRYISKQKTRSALLLAPQDTVDARGHINADSTAEAPPNQLSACALQCTPCRVIHSVQTRDMPAATFLTPFMAVPLELSPAAGARRRAAMCSAARPRAPASSGRAAPAPPGPAAGRPGPVSGFPDPAAAGARSSRASSPAMAPRASALSTVHARREAHACQTCAKNLLVCTLP